MLDRNGNEIPARECEWCSAQFTPIASENQRFHSRYCAYRFEIAQEIAESNARIIEATRCARCGETHSYLGRPHPCECVDCETACGDPR